jgi:hypothetical protein
MGLVTICPVQASYHGTWLSPTTEETLMTTASKLPTRFALAGFIIAAGVMVASWFIYKFNPFHLPTVAQAQQMGNFSEPFGLRLFDDLTFLICPGALLFFFTMDMGGTANWIMWGVIVLINGPIYYGLWDGARRFGES